MSLRDDIGWDEPTLSVFDGRTIVKAPESLAGRELVSVVGYPCNNRHQNGRDVCGQIQGHYGPCWKCSPELVHQAGPFAMRRVLP